MTFEEAAAVMMGGSGTARASLFSAICSLPVAAQVDIKINGVPTGYGIKIFRANPFTPGFGTVYTKDYYDSDGTVRDPPDEIYEDEYYYGALCMNGEVICILNEQKCKNHLHTVGYTWWSINGGNNRIRVKRVEDLYEYNILLDTQKCYKYSDYLGVGFDATWSHQYIYYDIDDSGNITPNPTESKTQSGTYTSFLYFSFYNNKTDCYLHGYSDDDALRQRLIAFKQAIDNM